MKSHPQAEKKQSTRHLSARIIAISRLNQSTREAMFSLYNQYYEATAQEQFFTDLENKDQVIVLYDNEQQVRGFSTLKLFDYHYNEQHCQIIFSGDTIIHHKFWGDQSLAFSWLRWAGKVKALHPQRPLYYLLIVKGHRTYRYLQAFTHQYYPHWQQTTPTATKQLMNQLGKTLFSQYYQAEKGIIHFPTSHGQLRAQWAEPSVQALSRPEVQFFLQQNPDYRLGDELLCFTELCAANLRPLIRRVFVSGIQ